MSIPTEIAERVTAFAPIDQDSALPLPLSWRPISGVGPLDSPHPSVLEVAQDVWLMYAGEINGLIGASESLKTWMALMAAREALRDGTPTLYLDFEGSRDTIVSRLRRMGTPEEALANFHYSHPTEALPEKARAEMLEMLVQQTEAGLIILDGWTEFLAMLDLEVNSNSDCARAENLYLKPLRGDDRSVIVLHHVPHESDRALGAQHFRSMITGSCIALGAASPMTSEGRANATVTIAKDRPAAVRAYFTSKNVGELVVEGRPEMPSVAVGVKILHYTTSGREIPTRCMDEVMLEASRLYVERHGKGATQRQIRNRVKSFRTETIQLAIRKLALDGRLRADGVSRGSTLYVPVDEGDEQAEL
jgi:hypothetical protein